MQPGAGGLAHQVQSIGAHQGIAAREHHHGRLQFGQLPDQAARFLAIQLLRMTAGLLPRPGSACKPGRKLA